MALLTNLATNPHPAEASTGWSRSGGTSSWTRVLSGFGGSDDSYMEMEFTVVPGTVVGEVSYEQPVTASLLSAAIEVASSRAQVFTPLVTFLDASDNVLEVFYGADVAAPAGAVIRVGVAAMSVPAMATTVRVTAAVSIEDGTAPVVGDTVQVSRAMISESLTLQDYFDGSYENAAWTGDPFDSSSQITTSTAPVLVGFPDYTPVPRVGITFPGFHPLTAKITVERIVGTKVSRVRSAIMVSVFGGYGLLDMEAPKSVLSTYRAAQYDADGLFLGYTDSASITFEFPGVCIHQPLDPSKNVAYKFARGAAGDLVRPTPGELFYPEGRGEAVWIGGARRGLQNVNLDGYTLTLEDAAKVESLFGSQEDPQMPILCIRSSEMDLPPVLFALVEEPHRIGVNRNRGGERIRWAMTGQEVAPPAEGLIVPLLTYADLDASYATYDERDAAYATYLEMDTDWSLAGAANGA